MVASWKDFKRERRMIKIRSRTNLNGGELERLEVSQKAKPKWWRAGLIDS